MNSKDDPMLLLNKKSYKQVVMKMKAPFLNNLFMPCCYSQENSYKLYKWIPNDARYDVTNGKSGKRIMKIKEKSGLALRTLCPSGCRGYVGKFQAENSRKIVFEMERQTKPTMLCIGRPTCNVFVTNPNVDKKDEA
jgi:hypothetical protein